MGTEALDGELPFTSSPAVGSRCSRSTALCSVSWIAEWREGGMQQRRGCGIPPAAEEDLPRCVGVVEMRGRSHLPARLVRPEDA